MVWKTEYKLDPEKAPERLLIQFLPLERFMIYRSVRPYVSFFTPEDFEDKKIVVIRKKRIVAELGCGARHWYRILTNIRVRGGVKLTGRTEFTDCPTGYQCYHYKGTRGGCPMPCFS